MQTKYHQLITRSCFETWFSETALQAIINANIKQDSVRNQFGHDYIHFDGCAFDAGFKYIDDQYLRLYEGIALTRHQDAWTALGRITHSWQDFYSHSNYVLLWIDEQNRLAPDEIVPDDEHLLTHEKLISGKNYGVIEFLAMLPGIKKLILPLMRDDSHAKMNLDGPESNPLFKYAYHAAVKRTLMILHGIQAKLESECVYPSKINHYRGYS